MSNKQNIVFNVLVAVVFSVIMTLFMTWLGGGISPNSPVFPIAYLKGVAIGILIAVPLSFVATPLIRKFVSKYIKKYYFIVYLKPIAHKRGFAKFCKASFYY